MKNSNSRLVIRIALCLFFNMLAVMSVLCQRHEYEGYYLRSENYPAFSRLWTPCGAVTGGPLACRDWRIGRIPGFADAEIQGVTHDNDNWYFTWTFDNTGYLCKVPVGVPLENDAFADPRVSIVNMAQFPPLNQGTYWHWGDPDHFTFAGIDYIAVPITAPSICSNPPKRICRDSCDCGVGNTCEPQTPILGIFRAADLSLAAYGKLTAQSSTGWCAVDPRSTRGGSLTGALYTSEDFDYTTNIPRVCIDVDSTGDTCKTACDCPGSIFGCVPEGDCENQDYHFLYRRELLRYGIPLDLLPLSGYREIPLTPMGIPLEFRGENGEFLELYNMQGGEFTPSGELLYISAGSGCCYRTWFRLGGGVGQQWAVDGIHVFDTRTWREVARSNNNQCVGDIHCPKGLPRYFDYFYELNCVGSGSWSPEGLTIWDLDDGRAQNISGQLHVLVYKFRKTGANREVFEHFGGRLYVDPVTGVDDSLPASLWDNPLPGGPLTSLKTFGYAYNYYPAWDGSQVLLRAGVYPETGTFGRNGARVLVTSQGGTAILGKLAPLKAAPRKETRQ